MADKKGKESKKSKVPKPKENMSGAFNLHTVPFFDHLKRINSKTILLAGCGGGYDVYSGVPLYFSLKALGYKVVFWSLAFTSEAKVQEGELVSPNCHKVTAQTKNPGYQPYFPEKFMCDWFKEVEKDETMAVYTINRTGVKPYVAAMREVIKREGIDTVILVDGGTDSLMRGDEEKLGSPNEDMLSIAGLDSVTEIDEEHKLLICTPNPFHSKFKGVTVLEPLSIGFGVDAYHGVSHGRFLENVGNLIKTGGFLGVFTCMKEMPEVQKFISLCTWVFERMEDSSIVASSIINAVQGEFGDFHSSERTQGTELFINELMAQYWCFKLGPVAKAIHFLDNIKDTNRINEVMVGIELYRKTMERENVRLWLPYPH